MNRPVQHGGRWAAASLLGGALFLSLAHHAFDLWERPALWIFLSIVLFIPLCAWGFFLLSGKLIPFLKSIPAWRMSLFVLAALVIAAFIAWRVYRAPADYQALTIAPVLSGAQTAGLLELKADGAVLPVRKDALENGWEKRGEALVAGPEARPLSVTFRVPANSRVEILFVTSPDSGGADLSFEGSRTRVDLAAPAGATTVGFRSTYRGVPGPVFAAFLGIVDVLAFGLLLLAALIVQEAGQRIATPGEGRRGPSPRWGLALTVGLGALLHLVNLLTSNLVLGADSPAYLRGAVHLAQFGDLDGVPISRGPGTTLLFAPVFWVFGRDPWGLKIFMHLMALACIPLCYQLGWLLTRDRRAALLGGLIAVFSPDLFVYANYVMADLPNLFFVLLFCNLLILGLETRRRRWIFGAMAAAAFTTLIRSEGLSLIVIGMAALAVQSILDWRKGRLKQPGRVVLNLALALVIACAPIAWWVGHNQRHYGFWGLSDYIGHALYDGWVYFGNASRLPFSDENSQAVRTLEQVAREHELVITDPTGVPTGGELLPSLLGSGYTLPQAYALLKAAALDSIESHPAMSLELLMLKFRTGLRPDSIDTDTTFTLPGEPARELSLKGDFFDDENLSLPPLIRVQRWTNGMVARWYPLVYPVWVLFCVLALVLSIFRNPPVTWLALAAVVLTRIFLSLAISVPFWRFTLSGWYPLQIAAIAWLFVAMRGIKGLAEEPWISRS